MLIFNRTHISLASSCVGHRQKVETKRPQNVVSDQGLHYLLTECSIKILMKMKNTAQQPLNQKRTGPIDKNGKFHLA